MTKITRDQIQGQLLCCDLNYGGFTKLNGKGRSNTNLYHERVKVALLSSKDGYIVLDNISAYDNLEDFEYQEVEWFEDIPEDGCGFYIVTGCKDLGPSDIIVSNPNRVYKSFSTRDKIPKNIICNSINEDFSAVPQDFNEYYLPNIDARKAIILSKVIDDIQVESKVHKLEDLDYVQIIPKSPNSKIIQINSIEQLDEMEFHPLSIPHYDILVRNYINQFILSCKCRYGDYDKCKNYFFKEQDKMYDAYKNGSKNVILIVDMNPYKILVPIWEFNKYHI